tara:strand:+ start:712 stop:918 length:207 start_codon:yes stop_codon:yes gene_type:complete
MSKSISIEDTSNEVYIINPINVVYVKEKQVPSSNIQGRSVWKISLVNGETIITHNSIGVESLIELLKA